MRNCWRLFFLNLPKNEGWGGGMGNCWSCFISSRDGFGRPLRSRKIIQRFGFGPAGGLQFFRHWTIALGLACYFSWESEVLRKEWCY